MKIAVIGGAGVRVPLLINALGSAGLGVDEFALYDPDARRLALIADLAARRSGGARVTTHGVVAPAVDGARFVITSIRVGGIEARIHDEPGAGAIEPGGMVRRFADADDERRRRAEFKDVAAGPVDGLDGFGRRCRGRKERGHRLSGGRLRGEEKRRRGDDDAESAAEDDLTHRAPAPASDLAGNLAVPNARTE